jgi:hypothetical protein
MPTVYPSNLLSLSQTPVTPQAVAHLQSRSFFSASQLSAPICSVFQPRSGGVNYGLRWSVCKKYHQLHPRSSSVSISKSRSLRVKLMIGQLLSSCEPLGRTRIACICLSHSTIKTSREVSHMSPPLRLSDFCFVDQRKFHLNTHQNLF